MALTAINGEDRLAQQTFAAHLERVLGWDSVYALRPRLAEKLDRGHPRPAFAIPIAFKVANETNRLASAYQVTIETILPPKLLIADS